MDYVGRYKRLEDQASGAESKAEDYRRRASDVRWDQARIAFEAVESGAYNQKSFAKAVGTPGTTIWRQCNVWASYGDIPLAKRPAYSDAVAMAEGTTQAAETDRKQVVNARAVLRDPALARELVLKDPEARAVIRDAIREHDQQSPQRKSYQEPSPDEASAQCVGDMARAEQSLIRLVDHLNAARRSGYIRPAHIREFADKLRLYADALADIAESRGLTDEALAEWIGAE